MKLIYIQISSLVQINVLFLLKYNPSSKKKYIYKKIHLHSSTMSFTKIILARIAKITRYVETLGKNSDFVKKMSVCYDKMACTSSLASDVMKFSG